MFSEMLRKFGAYVGKRSDKGTWIKNFRTSPWYMLYKGARAGKKKETNSYCFRSDIMDMYVDLAEKHDMLHYIVSYDVHDNTFKDLFGVVAEDAYDARKLSPVDLTTIIITKKAAMRRIGKLYDRADAESKAATATATDAAADAVETETESETEIKSETKIKSETESETEIKSETKIKSEIKSESETESESESETESESESETESESD
jgi:hypothetical protein